MHKVVNPGRGKYGQVYLYINFVDGKLSITGVEGPRSNGDCSGGCGQIKETEIIDYASGWDATMYAGVQKIWDEWHLNDMQAGCAHQHAMGWDERRIDESKPSNAYGKHSEGQHSATWNMLVWVREDEHPHGLLMRPCPVCEYKYGSKWLSRVVPKEVIEILEMLPAVQAPGGWPCRV